MSDRALGPSDLQDYMLEQGIQGEILYLESPTRTVEAAALAVGTRPDQIVKSILFLIEDQPVLAITCGTANVERRAIANLYGVGRKRVKLASPDQVVIKSGFEVGAMPPFGHSQPIRTLIDRRVLEHPDVFAGGGAENALVRVSPQEIVRVSQAQVLELQEQQTAETGAVSPKFLLGLLAVLVVVGFFVYQQVRPRYSRSANVIAWLRAPEKHAGWAITAGERCGTAPFLAPTNGFIGFLWDDSFRPGHRHSGLDIFGGTDVNVTPIVAAYSGYLTRQADWKSTVIIRIPSDPIQPGRQIWTYYTHMADVDGSSFIVDDFPPGTSEVYVEAGTLLGYQGNYSGDRLKPTGIHLHFSIVRDDGQGNYLNELEIQNTLDPSPYMGLSVNAKQDPADIPVCK